jgi:hypothetical protein
MKTEICTHTHTQTNKQTNKQMQTNAHAHKHIKYSIFGFVFSNFAKDLSNEEKQSNSRL